VSHNQAFLPPLFSFQMRLVDANGKLASLAGHQGFRKYVMATANQMGITGTIQRYHHTDVIIKFEGYRAEVEPFLDFLRTCRGQEMFSDFGDHFYQATEFRLYTDFSIVVDFSRTTENGGKVVKGPHSDDTQYDKQSDYSADSGILLGSQRRHGWS
jgi:acylphosphatase